MKQSHLQITINWVIEELKKDKAKRSEDIFTDKPDNVSLSDFKNDLRFITKFIGSVYKSPITTSMLFVMERSAVEELIKSIGWKAGKNGLELLHRDFSFDQKTGRFICKDDKTICWSLKRMSLMAAI